MSDEQCFSERLEEFYEEHSSSLFRFAVSQTRSEEDAQDVLQIAFMEALKSLADYERTNWKNWFFKRIKSRAQDKARRQSKSPVVLAGDIAGDEDNNLIADAPDAAPLPDELVKRADSAHRVRQALERMKNEQQRRVLELLYYEAAIYPTLKEVADAMGISLANAKKLHQRAKEALKFFLRDLAQEMNIQTDKPDHES